jgi:acetyl esterase/lipase
VPGRQVLFVQLGHKIIRNRIPVFLVNLKYHFFVSLSVYVNQASSFIAIALPSNHYNSSPMDSFNNQLLHHFRFFRVYKDGRIEKFHSTHKIPPSDDQITGVRSKDVVISSDPAISARIFLPKLHDPTRKLPVLFYVHGGGFCFQSAFSPEFHNLVSSLVAKSNAIAISVEYGLFPERPLPACYEDSWAGLQWVTSHANRNGPEPWLNEYADFNRVFIGGDSGGGNISHTLAVRVGTLGLQGVKLVGLILVHPFFGGTEDDHMWLYMCPTNGGLEDPRLKPSAEDLSRLRCEKVLIFLAQNDHLRGVGGWYYEELKKSGWVGNVEVVEHEGENHVFHLRKPDCEKAIDLVNKFSAFINHMLQRL